MENLIFWTGVGACMVGLSVALGVVMAPQVGWAIPVAMVSCTTYAFAEVVRIEFEEWRESRKVTR